MFPGLPVINGMADGPRKLLRDAVTSTQAITPMLAMQHTSVHMHMAKLGSFNTPMAISLALGKQTHTKIGTATLDCLFMYFSHVCCILGSKNILNNLLSIRFRS